VVIILWPSVPQHVGAARQTALNCTLWRLCASNRYSTILGGERPAEGENRAQSWCRCSGATKPEGDTDANVIVSALEPLINRRPMRPHAYEAPSLGVTS
jgi:hypothetical protein